MLAVPYTHFPARGRKHYHSHGVIDFDDYLETGSLYPFPRKGTETSSHVNCSKSLTKLFLIPISPQGDGNDLILFSLLQESLVPYTHFPARGRKRCLLCSLRGRVLRVPYTHFPARGRKHLNGQTTALIEAEFLIPISPQGDGNYSFIDVFAKWSSTVPYTHFPARGRKLQLQLQLQSNNLVPYTHFPARGRKQGDAVKVAYRLGVVPYTHFPARGRKQSKNSFICCQFKCCCSLYPFPRKGTETM